MKSRLFFLFFALLATQTLFSQIMTPADDAAIRKVTEQLTEKYNLSADQAKQVYQIQQRKNRNLTEIAVLQQSNQAQYQAKVRNIQEGTLANIRRVLNSKEQVDVFQQTQAEVRGLRSAKRKEMTAQGASKEAVEAAVLAIYAE
jgi:TolA-binding protein